MTINIEVGKELRFIQIYIVQVLYQWDAKRFGLVGIYTKTAFFISVPISQTYFD